MLFASLVKCDSHYNLYTEFFFKHLRNLKSRGFLRLYSLSRATRSDAQRINVRRRFRVARFPQESNDDPSPSSFPPSLSLFPRVLHSRENPGRTRERFWLKRRTTSPRVHSPRRITKGRSVHREFPLRAGPPPCRPSLFIGCYRI